MKKTCEKCKNYKSTKEFNCEYYNIIIPNFHVAKKCKFYMPKIIRKRCNKCKHLIYNLIPGKKKYFYQCEITKKMKIYTALTNCNKFERKMEKSVVKATSVENKPL